MKISDFMKFYFEISMKDGFLGFRKLFPREKKTTFN